MKESKSVTEKTPSAGMTVDEATALTPNASGKTFYFCSDQLSPKFCQRRRRGNPGKSCCSS